MRRWMEVVGEVGGGVAVLMSGLDYERALLAGVQLGIMQACLDVVIPYVRERKQFGKPVGSFQLIQAKVAEMPENIEQANATGTDNPAPQRNPELSGLGLQLAPLSDDLRSKFNLSGDAKGVVVTDVTPDSPAAQRGIKPGDVIVEVQQQGVKTPEDVQQRLQRFRQEDRKSVLFLMQSGDNLRWVPLPIQGDVPGERNKSPG